MKSILLLLALVSTLVAGSGHAHAPKVSGPNNGRLLTQIEPHAEFFVTAERHAQLTFVDDDGKPTAAPAGLSVTLITGDRSSPTTLAFAPASNSPAILSSTTALPEGKNFPAILRLKFKDASATQSIRFQLNLALCGECQRVEYACICDH